MRAKTWIFIILFGGFFAALYFVLRPEGTKLFAPKTEEKPTLILWYTDESLTDYLNSSAIACLDKEGVRVEPVLKTGLEYVDEIYNASISDEEVGPDLFIIGSDWKKPPWPAPQCRWKIRSMYSTASTIPRSP